MSSVYKEYYEYLMSQDKSDLAIEIMNLEMPLNEAKDKELKVYKRALELASKPRNDWGCTDREYNNYKYDTYYDYYLDQAKKELEEQDVKD